MTTIILHGHLKELYPHEIRVEANSAAEAIQSLALIPALRRKDGKRHTVVVDGFGTLDALNDRREIDVLNVYPVAAGEGGKPGVAQTVIGIVIVIVGYLIWNPQVMMMGATMILGGVLQMLAPQPEVNGSDEEKSRYLGNGRNTVNIGTRIQMIYGRRKAYGHYISFDIDASVFNTAPAEWYSSPFTNNGELTYSAAPPVVAMPPPVVIDSQPHSVFRGIDRPDEMEGDDTTYVTFDPVYIRAGVYDMTFSTGTVLNVEVTSSGTTSQAILVGSVNGSNPTLGTPIVFTQNYV